MLPAVLPAVRALAFDCIPQDELLDVLCNPSSLRLLQQINALFVNANIFSNTFSTPHELLRKLQPFLPKTLVHLNRQELSLYPRMSPSLLHLRIQFRASYESLAKDFEGNDELRLKSLYLRKYQASPANDKETVSLNLREPDRVNLLAICSSRKVDVIEEEQPCFASDPYISSEFWRRQRELKRLKGVQ